MNFETIIGIEVHAEIKSEAKIYSPAPHAYGEAPNTMTHVIDWGYPGVLPTLNKQVVEQALRAALALNCEITHEMSFDRKNYFYPDNPKGYQITQDRTPIGRNGYIEIEVNGVKKRIGVTRVHIEEDAGKSTHYDGYSLVDLNRQGAPLIEIVSEPEIHTAEEAAAYIEQLRAILLYTDVSDVKMEEGSMRCDANVSIRPIGQEAFGTKSELKNLNSISNIQKGIEFEITRQTKSLLAGEVLRQETRRFDEAARQTVVMRVKEGASDYRYSPEADLSTLYIDHEWIARAKASLPELPQQRRLRYENAMELTAYDAQVLTLSKETSDFFDATVDAGANPKQAANWMMGEVQAYLNKNQLVLAQTPLTPQTLAEMINLIEDGTISSKMAKKVFMHLIEKGGSADAAVDKLGLKQISDTGLITDIVTAVLDANPQSIEDFKNGKDRAIGFLVGQIMKQTKGQANPQVVNQILMAEISKR
ncbi:MAG: Asp-tRNA(Asn)/Glu-tRNA(Gln) amidotransferase subunit GatB [Culicoidibacterales bacterium]